MNDMSVTQQPDHVDLTAARGRIGGRRNLPRNNEIYALGDFAGPILLSAARASPRQRRAALLVGLTVLAACIATLPFATIAGPPLAGFVLIQQAWMGITDLIIAALLLGQFWVQPARRLNVVAGGYLFTALTTVPYALSFPGGFSERGLLITGPLSTPWIFLAWYAALPLVVIASSVFPSRGQKDTDSDRRIGILVAVFTAVGAVVALTTLVIAGYDWLPAVWAGNAYTPEVRVAIGTAMGLALLAFLVLAGRRPYSVLDTWLMVLMFTWLSAMVIGGGVIGTQRYDIGNDVSRVLYMLASTFVLLVLLSQTITLHAGAIRDREQRLKEMESILIHLSRVSELAQNVSALAHEVNQPLTAISNYAAACMELADSAPERLKPLIRRLSEQSTRAADIVQNIRDFVAQHKSEKRVENIHDLLQRAVRLALAGDHQGSAMIEIRCSPDASSAMIDRVQIEQVVFNLVRNAVEAMAECPRRVLTLATELMSDGMVEVSVTDTGPGLAPEIRSRLFQPFVTTKQAGLGVGLSVCRVIVEAHGGTLKAEENSGGGTIFRFTIPRFLAAS